MVVDYSKWDKLELSDDSDIEGECCSMHPPCFRTYTNIQRQSILMLTRSLSSE